MYKAGAAQRARAWRPAPRAVRRSSVACASCAWWRSSCAAVHCRDALLRTLPTCTQPFSPPNRVSVRGRCCAHAATLCVVQRCCIAAPTGGAGCSGAQADVCYARCGGGLYSEGYGESGVCLSKNVIMMRVISSWLLKPAHLGLPCIIAQPRGPSLTAAANFLVTRFCWRS